ncbi:Complement C1q-like protein 3 [Mactra antiquata]
MSRIKHEILLLLCLLCGHIYAQNNLDISPEAFQILVTQVENLSKLVEHQNGVINELQDKFKFQENLNNELMDRLYQQERIMEDLSAKLVTHDKHQSSISISTGPKTTNNNSASRQSSDQQKDVKHLRQGISRKRQTPSTTVAFFATITQMFEDNLGIHQNLIFEDVLTNIGNGYNSHHGVFTVPVSGIYLLTSSLLSRNGQEYWVEMVVNGSPIARLNGHGTEGRHSTGTQTAIVFLNKGDDVAIQNYYHVDSFWGNKYSSFGGVLLQEYEANSLPDVIG